MKLLDVVLKKEKRCQRTVDIQEDLYIRLNELSVKYFDASVSKLINLAIYDFNDGRETVTMCQMKDLGKHTVIFKESALEVLNQLKKKYNIPIYVILNLAIKDAVENLESRIDK